MSFVHITAASVLEQGPVFFLGLSGIASWLWRYSLPSCESDTACALAKAVLYV